MKRVLVQVSEEDYQRAADLAASEGLSFSGLVRRLLKLYLRKATAKRSGRPK